MANPNTKALKTSIKIKKSSLYNNLLYSLFMIAIGVFTFLNENGNHWTNYVWFILGALALTRYFFERNKGLLTIDHKWLKQHDLFFPKRIKLHEIIKIAKNNSGYVLKTKDTKLRIYTHNIEKDSLKELHQILEKLTISIT